MFKNDSRGEKVTQVHRDTNKIDKKGNQNPVLTSCEACDKFSYNDQIAGFLFLSNGVADVRSVSSDPHCYPIKLTKTLHGKNCSNIHITRTAS